MIKKVALLLSRKQGTQRRTRRGFVLALTITVLTVLLILGLFSITAAIQSRNIAFHKQTVAEAAALAETGVWVMKATIETNLQQGTQLVKLGGKPYTISSTSYPGANFSSPMPAIGTYDVTATAPSASNDPWLPMIQLVAHGTTTSNQTATVIVYMRPANFGKYAYFEQEEINGGWMVNGMN
jgi:hypothetical protein